MLVRCRILLGDGRGSVAECHVGLDESVWSALSALVTFLLVSRRNEEVASVSYSYLDWFYPVVLGHVQKLCDEWPAQVIRGFLCEQYEVLCRVRD